MIQLLGEFDCKLDAKGRLMVPSSLKKQLPSIEQEGLVINRGFEKHLVIYPKKVWEGIVAELSKLNQYEKKTREFIRFFTRGATELSLDASGRVLLPKSLLEFAGINGDVVLACQFDKIEVWSKAAYDNLLDNEPENFANLAEEVMGGKDRRDEDGK
ncbi:division/cell wall cluster transcriptional repressor MraZ [Pedobacter sp. LMG 31464]|uniref:Transcriptional regulator MraZ n=1 Tax=Pedobacter planticolens TaxID=2679964 RepID=A0A923DWU3_9SPHI|nr:division/cell wall cluster transcriptional repressor MraZ [Pedobacter planticolens]MBB2144125.1 division/cell wall cluster transcriptional repressor MraZ [Pedobacter planticolens]